MKVLVMGHARDQHAVHMLGALEAAGVQAELFDTSLFPMKAQLTWNPEESSGQIVLPNGNRLAFNDIHSVYWRTINSIKIADVDPEQRYLANRDAMSTLRTFLNGTPAKWVNSWKAYEYHKEKPLQLAHAARLGVKIPRSIVTNSPDDVLNFVKSVNKAIYKPVYGGAHTDYVSEELLDAERLKSALAVSPVTLQEYIAGTNIRTYVIGEETFSAEIVSGNVDFREDDSATLRPVELPEKLKALSIQVAREFDLQWTAIDWRRDETGEHYFLEANPSPMFIHFEKQTGYPITEKMVALLTS
ncbi:ATP-grasp domain-containing protein [Pleionea sediminis]|uniref:ATP-grasp domain-containing protein n=1 Tax=Pleionea sediminis TaxID=2569479 RepID=UPI0011853F1D|nr:hypothetical protein [Pleionea sediminis]